MISQTSEYALRAVVYLATIGGGPATTQEIAAATRVPAGYLSKVLRQLARAGLLFAQRGVGGGFALSRAAEDISALDVLRSADSWIHRITECPLGIPGHASLCALHQLIDDVMAQTERAFAAVSLQDLLTSSQNVRSLCDPDVSQPIQIKEPENKSDPLYPQ